MEFTNGLTRAQEERLAILLEEMGEVSQIIGKIFRHGYLSHSPSDSKKVTNMEYLERELGDVLQMVRLMEKAGDISSKNLFNNVVKRWSTVQKYLHHQPKELFEANL